MLKWLPVQMQCAPNSLHKKNTITDGSITDGVSTAKHSKSKVNLTDWQILLVLVMNLKSEIRYFHLLGSKSKFKNQREGICTWWCSQNQSKSIKIKIKIKISKIKDEVFAPDDCYRCCTGIASLCISQTLADYNSPLLSMLKM